MQKGFYGRIARSTAAAAAAVLAQRVSNTRCLTLFAAVLVLLFAPTWRQGLQVASAATINVAAKPAFQADLTNTLKLQGGTGSPTFTRATIATVMDWEGLVKNVVSGEARFQGARRAQNLMPANTEAGASGWVSAGTTPPALTTDTVGGVQAAKVTFTAASNTGYAGSRIDRSPAAFSSVAGQQYQLTAYVKLSRALTGSEDIRILWTGANGLGSSFITSSNSTQFLNGLTRVSTLTAVLGVSGSEYPSVTIDNALGSSVDVWITKIQVEAVTGQSNTNPSEYVSVGRLAAPYQGAGVDGVQYFNTLNGNTVSNYVVTPGTGQKITASTAPAGSAAGAVDASGPLGYLAEGARTNSLTYSSDTTGWNHYQTTLATNVVSPDGLTAGTTVTEDGTNNFHAIEIGGAHLTIATQYTLSIFLKQGTRRYVGLASNSSGSGFWAVVDTTTWTISGSGTTGGGVYTSSSIVPYPNGWYRLIVTGTTQNSGVGSSGLVFGSNVAAPATSLPTYTGSSTFIVWGWQAEAAPFASSYIPTAAASVARNADVLTYPSAGNVTANAGTASFDFTVSPALVANSVERDPFSLDTSGMQIFLGAAGSHLIAKDRVDNIQSDSGIIPAINTLYKTAVSWLVGGSQVFYVNGGIYGSLSQTATPSITTISMGMNSGVSQLYGTIRNVKIWKKALTSTQLTNMTSSGATSITKAVVPQTTVKSTGGTGLVGWWKFDEGTGTRANDSSGLGNFGTLTGTPSWVSGKLGKALTFDGTTNYVSVANTVAVPANITVSAWVKSVSIGTEQMIISKYYNQTGLKGFNFEIYQSKLSFGVDTGTFLQGNTTLLSGVWYYVTATYDGTTIRLYLNGAADGTLATSAGISNPTGNMNIGRYTYNNTLLFNGPIDDVRVYNRALSQAEVTALYKSTAAVVNASTNTSGGSLTSGLVGLWSFDGKDMNWGTNKALDRSGNGNNGTLVSMSTTTSPTPGKIGQALKFNGTNSNVSATSVASLNFGTGDFTVSQWIKFSDLGTGTNGFISKDNYSAGTTYNGWLMNVCTGCVPGGIGLETRNLVSGSGPDTHARYAASNFTTGQWYHLVGIRSSGTLYLYVNGVLRSTAIEGSATNVTNSQNLLLGSLSAGAPQWFTGSLDDVRVYNRALTATEIKALYNLGK